MSASRKLQSEIVQVLKKVEEGVLLFDDIWEKVYAAGQQSLKEKYEGDLKKEIKKLQRLRDQVKNWLSSSEVKDKSPLTEARKIIESKMEQFKICEKDTKTKAYSKEGLAREARTDPKEIEREEKRCWLNDCLERLGDLIDSIEVDVEKMTSVKGGKTKMKDQLEKLDTRVQKIRWHMARLEQILKLLDNEDMDPSDLDGIKDDVDYYIESAVDDEGAVGVDEEFDIYEDLHLDAILIAAGTEEGGIALPTASPIDPSAVGSTPPLSESSYIMRADSSTEADAAAAALKKTSAVAPATAPAIGKQIAPVASKSAILPAASASPLKAATAPVLQLPTAPKAAAAPASPGKATGSPMLSGAVGPAVGAAQKPVVAQKDAGAALESSASVAATPQSSWAAHAASATAPLPKAAVPGLSALRPPDSLPLVPSVETLSLSPIGNTTHPTSFASSSSTVIAPGSFPPQGSALPVMDMGHIAGVQQQSVVQQLNSSSAALAAPMHRSTVGPPLPPQLPPQQQQLQQQLNPAHISAGGGSLLQLQQQQQQQQAMQQSHQAQQNPSFHQQQQQQQSNYANHPQGRGGLAINSDVQFTISMLKQSALNSTEVLESDRQTGYTPRNQYNTHSSFPSQPPPVIESGSLFERLPADSLFFAFYHQQGSYQQFLAAKQLKKQSWRFHKKYMTWFQRHEEPKITSDDYEEGTYVYFDYESGWCQRIKSEFKFEYNYLEDETAQSTLN